MDRAETFYICSRHIGTTCMPNIFNEIRAFELTCFVFIEGCVYRGFLICAINLSDHEFLLGQFEVLHMP